MRAIAIDGRQSGITRFLATEVSERAECPSWLFWQMGSAPYLGGGFGHFYAYAPTKIEYAIHQFAMEAKDQLDVLDRRLAESEYLAGGRGQTHSRGFQIECSPKIK